jgi:hypothetical protein
VEYGVLKKFLEGKRGEYSLEEDENEISITFLPLAPLAKGKLGFATYMKVFGRKVEGRVEMVRVTIIEGEEESEVSVESLDGWLDFVKNA